MSRRVRLWSVALVLLVAGIAGIALSDGDGEQAPRASGSTPEPATSTAQPAAPRP